MKTEKEEKLGGKNRRITGCGPKSNLSKTKMPM
jgi:hypothetical protein